ncbi:MAG TPA: hypothetical protein VF762_17535 [Blastocatellia bacterium]|jgi:hypothetical protein
MSQVKKIFVCLFLWLFLLVNYTDKITALTKADSGISHKTICNKLTAAYKQYFGLSVPYPAYVKGQSQTMGGSYWTSVAYVGRLRYRLHLLADGTIQPAVNEVKRPQGNFRVAVVAIDYGNTNIAGLLTNLWVDTQKQINVNYASYAQGLQPAVQFTNTNFLAPSSEISDPRDKEEIKAFVESRGYQRDSFDIFVSLDLNAQSPAGGFTSFGGEFVYMGYFYEASSFADLTELSDYKESRLFWIAKAVYDHECGHVFGWEHEWAMPQKNNAPGDCITDPALYGWTDTDGDDIPEILDPTPYGMTYFH